RPGPAPQQDPRGKGQSAAKPVWRMVAAALALVEVVGLVVLVLSPPFQVNDVAVSGARHVSPQQVVEAAGLQTGSSIFTVNGATVRQRLDSTVWIRSSQVTSQLPGRVEITVDEWQPVAVFQPRQGGAVFLDERGDVLGPAGGGAAALPKIQGPTSNLGAGHRAIDPRLLTPLVNVARGLPDLMGQHVVAFQLDRCWNLVMVAGKGWRAMFGRMLTPDDYASLQPKVAALTALRTQVRFDDPSLYVNLMNPSAPAVGHGQDLPPAPTPSPTPSASASHPPSPSGSASPSPSPSPSPRPSPSPTASGIAQCA
ncbi:MAG: FtsQ-type POTRA domain-containing protein, partial [Candidatus Dormibacteraeota bacterium]|nr:FtsQ-type POTRA domain-containing protein [Candidatus Dormibacteraeota bacterium]